MRFGCSILVPFLIVIPSLPQGEAQTSSIEKNNEDEEDPQTSQLPPPSDLTDGQLSHGPSMLPSSPLENSVGPTISQSLSITMQEATPTPQPSKNMLSIACQNTPGFRIDSWVWELEVGLDCDDFRLFCADEGNLGSARDHCCVCKGPECTPFCNATDFRTRWLPDDDEFVEDSGGDDGNMRNIIILVASSLGVVMFFGGIYAFLKLQKRPTPQRRLPSLRRSPYAVP